jgi:hypothetical protein
MAVHVSVDRFEGDGKSIAVLLTDDGQTIQIPRALLPEGAKAGDVLELTLVLDAKAAAQLKAEARSIQQDLEKTDPGGDVTL